MSELQQNPQSNIADVGGSFYRPKTRGELYDALKNGIKCECVTSNVEFTSLALQSLNAMGCGDVKFKTYPSENIGWSIYESVS